MKKILSIVTLIISISFLGINFRVGLPRKGNLLMGERPKGKGSINWGNALPQNLPSYPFSKH
ncbi:MAG: hypothetical protein Ct9H300mP23_06620 [Nitrospinota bacterium]|nr:MAG: hypothetical protein Ct9H300mP23_06620 [Nitrospinota bacterium]